VLGAAHRVVLGPIADDRRRDVRVRVHVHQARGRIVGAVRAREADLQEPRIVALVLVHESDGLIARPACRVQLLRQLIRLCAVIVPADPRLVRIAIRRDLGEPLAVVADEALGLGAAGFVDEHVAVAVRMALWVEVILPDAAGVVAGFAKHRREFMRVRVGHASVAKLAVVPGLEPRQDSRARRRATGRRAVGGAEEHALVGDAVEVRRLHARVTVRADRVASVLIAHHEQDVRALAWLRHRYPPSRCCGKCCGGCADELATVDIGHGGYSLGPISSNGMRSKSIFSYAGESSSSW